MLAATPRCAHAVYHVNPSCPPVLPLLQVGLPLRLRKFPSGVVVIQGSQFSDKQLCNNIQQLLQRKSDGGTATAAAGAAPALGPALSAADISAALSLPLTLAKEALLVAEAAGVLCRDDGPEGLRFFRNFFTEAQLVSWHNVAVR